MAVITISRQYGSGGDDVARRVCEILGYHYFDKALIAQVAGEIGLSAEAAEGLCEDTYQRQGFFRRLFGTSQQPVADIALRKPGAKEGEPLQVEALDDAQCVGLVREAVLAAYERDNVVIMGRGGQAVLREMPKVLHVRIVAPLGARTLRVKVHESTSMARAEKIVRRRDAAGAAYLQNFYEVDWDNPFLYHLLINTGKWEVEAAAQLIVSALPHIR